MPPEARGRSFDELARGLASGTVSRRRALRLMGAALVGSALGSLGGVAAADEECKLAVKKCKKNKQCCSGNCSGGKCAACPSGQVLCNGSCVSTSFPTGQTLNTTTCQCECPLLQNGATCTADTQCCSGNCQEGSCLPPTGPYRTTCSCYDGARPNACTSVDCRSDLFDLVCTPLCATHGGPLIDVPFSISCVPDATCAV